MPRLILLLTGLLTVSAATQCIAADAPTVEAARDGLLKAVKFFHTQVAVSGGGYVWRYSADLSKREGEAKTTATQAWVQPPGTPSVGMAFLDAYEATRDEDCLSAARATGMALIKGQMQSGGWDYSIEFDPAKRNGFAYRDVQPRRKQSTRSTLDDDTTQAAVRFLVRLDQALKFQDSTIHESVGYALDNLLKMQRPIGGWSHWWGQPAPWEAAEYPIQNASFPESWSRTWTKDFRGCYVLNDDLIQDIVDMLLLAHDTYQDPKYLGAAERAGEFLIKAQLPDPQPAWAQQYDVEMHPTWSRKFEPPAVTGGESQGALETLILLARRTGEKKYLDPIPRALAYLRSSLLRDGKLARFYELKTNKPLYFTKNYELTYDDSDMPTHYGFKVPSRLDRIEREYQQALQGVPLPAKSGKPGKASASLKADVQRILETLDERGAWVEKGRLKSDDSKDDSGVILSETFAKNIATLSRFLRAAPE